jgi:hypothetical protein
VPNKSTLHVYFLRPFKIFRHLEIILCDIQRHSLCFVQLVKEEGKEIRKNCPCAYAHTLKTHGTAEVRLHAFQTSALDGSELPAEALTAWHPLPGPQFKRRLSGLQSRPGRGGEEKHLCPSQESKSSLYYNSDAYVCYYFVGWGQHERLDATLGPLRMCIFANSIITFMLLLSVRFMTLKGNPVESEREQYLRVEKAVAARHGGEITCVLPRSQVIDFPHWRMLPRHFTNVKAFCHICYQNAVILVTLLCQVPCKEIP